MYKILIVDDDRDMLLLMERLLLKKGFFVITLFEVEDIFQDLENFKPDLLILDINLGSIDGREICHAVKSTSKYANIPIVLYSAESWPDLKIAECKASIFIQKPFSHNFLIEKIQELVAA